MTTLVHIKKKHSTSLQNYLNELNKDPEEVDADWGFFIDLEHNNHILKSKSNIKKHHHVHHHHVHHQHQHQQHHHHLSETERSSKMTNIGNILVLVGFIAYLILI